jgi:GxxExxY protein
VDAEKKTSDKVLYPERGYALQGAFFEVYNVLGPGFREETYRQALMQELRLRGIPFETENTTTFLTKAAPPIVIAPIRG